MRNGGQHDDQRKATEHDDLDRQVALGATGRIAATDALNDQSGPIKLVAMADVFKDRLTQSYDNLSKNPEINKDAHTLSDRGWAYLKMERASEALADFEAALKLDESQPFALCGRAHVLVQRGYVASAVADTLAISVIMLTSCAWT